jgi:hypothetical protein
MERGQGEPAGDFSFLINIGSQFLKRPVVAVDRMSSAVYGEGNELSPSVFELRSQKMPGQGRR